MSRICASPCPSQRVEISEVKTRFEGKREPKPIATHRQPELLDHEIGTPKIEFDWLKK